MAKVKNKKNSGLADKVRNKRRAEATKKVLNPFEVHVNCEKFKVLGRKLKHDRGLPGVSRAKAVQKRKETLGTEMKLMHKSNTFMDRRIGEADKKLSGEEKVLARFAAEQARRHSKKNIFNLADDVLTHRGQTLEEIEKFDDPRSSDDEDDDGRKFGGLDDDFVAEGHFGGGVLSKTDNNDGAKSHKDLIEQLIAESKKRKAEKQKLKEQTLDLTEKLDTDWKDLKPIVFKRPRIEEKNDDNLIDKLLSTADKRGEDYDKMMQELRFEKRGTPSDGLESEEKLAKQQKEKLEKLERERLERMRGFTHTNIISAATNKHRSADDLDDNFDLGDEPTYMVAYDKDGKPLLPEHVLKENSLRKKKTAFDNGISDSDDDDDDDKNGDGESSDDEDDDESEDDSLDDLKVDNSDDEDMKENNDKLDNEDGNRSDSDGEADNKPDNGSQRENSPECRSQIQNLSSQQFGRKIEISPRQEDEKPKENGIIESPKKRKVSEGESVSKKMRKGSQIENSPRKDRKLSQIENEKSQNIVPSIPNPNEDQSTVIATEILSKALSSSFLKARTDLIQDKPEPEKSNNLFNGEEVDAQIANQVKADLLARKVIMEKASKELPYTYVMPKEYEQLEELLSKHEPEYQAVILERLVKCYHPSLSEDNKPLLSKLFAYLLQYIHDIFSNLKKEKQMIKSFRIFCKIAPIMYDVAQHNIMNAKQCLTEVIVEKYEDYKKNRKTVPNLETLIFFKLVSLIFPTSDFRHPVVTPCLVFMSEILTRCKFNTPYSISRGLFITAMILEYTVLSKRFVPSAINFLRGIIFLSAKISILNPVQVVPPFRLHGKDAKLLVLEENVSDIKVESKMEAKDLIAKELGAEFKVRSLSTGVEMLKEMFTNCSDMETQEVMFEPHIQLLGRVDLELYPKEVAASVSETIAYMKDTLQMKTYAPLTREKKRPRALKLYEPDVQDVFTGSKSSKLTREQAEREKLKHKLRRETKGALREIRRDRAYIGSVRINKKIQSDNIRKSKVKEIYKDAAIQQSELNKLKRQK